MAGHAKRRPVDGSPFPYRLDTFGLDSEYDYDPFWASVRRLGRRARVAQRAPVPPGHPVGLELRLQPHRRARLARTRRCASRCSSAASPAASPSCGSASSRAASPGRAASSPTDRALGEAQRRRDRRPRPRPPRRRRAHGARRRVRRRRRHAPNLDATPRVLRPSRRRGPTVSSTSSPRCEIEQKPEDLVAPFEPQLLLRLRGRRPAHRLGVRRERQPARRAAAADPRFRHRALGRPGHDRSVAEAYELVETRRDRASATSASSRSSTRSGSTPVPNPEFFAGTASCRRGVPSALAGATMHRTPARPLRTVLFAGGHDAEPARGAARVGCRLGGHRPRGAPHAVPGGTSVCGHARSCASSSTRHAGRSRHCCSRGCSPRPSGRRSRISTR